MLGARDTAALGAGASGVLGVALTDVVDCHGSARGAVLAGTADHQQDEQAQERRGGTAAAAAGTVPEGGQRSSCEDG